jgi:hypothetical protein
LGRCRYSSVQPCLNGAAINVSCESVCCRWRVSELGGEVVSAGGGVFEAGHGFGDQFAGADAVDSEGGEGGVGMPVEGGFVGLGDAEPAGDEFDVDAVFVEHPEAFYGPAAAGGVHGDDAEADVGQDRYGQEVPELADHDVGVGDAAVQDGFFQEDGDRIFTRSSPGCGVQS